MALFNTNAFRITEQGLSVMWQKQQIIAQNIANQDTPGYNCMLFSKTEWKTPALSAVRLRMAQSR